MESVCGLALTADTRHVSSLGVGSKELKLNSGIEFLVLAYRQFKDAVTTHAVRKTYGATLTSLKLMTVT